MASGRFVSCTIATDKRLSLLSLESEYLYVKAIPHLDRDGLISADVLWTTVAPRRPNMAALQEQCWQEWVEVGLCTAYETDEGTVLHFLGFVKNQQGMRYDRESPSRFEVPPGYVRTETGLTPDVVRSDPAPAAELVRSKSGPTPDEVRTKSGSSPAQQQQQQQQQHEVEVEVQQQQQHQGEVRADVDEPAEIPAAVAAAFDSADIVGSVRLKTCLQWLEHTGQPLDPVDVLAWHEYRKAENVSRNGNPLRPAFIVKELQAGRQAPTKYYNGLMIAGQEYVPYVLE